MKTIPIDGAMLHGLASALEQRTRLLEIHLREIANNEKYQHHKGILKARQREIEKMRELLDVIDDELKLALGEQVESEVQAKNAPSSIPGILDEYCWKHEPGGWTCETCWLHIHLAAFFEAVAAWAAIEAEEAAG